MNAPKIFGYDFSTISAMQQGTHNPAPLPRLNGRMVVSEYEKREWSRMAQDAYANDRNDIGHRFSMAATLSKGESMPLAQFDALQSVYRTWLIDGIKAVPAV